MKPLGVHVFRNGYRAVKIALTPDDVRRLEADLAAMCEAWERAAREAMADPEVWRKLRNLWPSPASIEGWNGHD